MNKIKVPKKLKKELNKLKKEKTKIKIKNIFSKLILPIVLLINLFVHKKKSNKKYFALFYNEDDDDYPEWLSKEELKPTFYDLIIKYADRLNIEDSTLYKKAYVDRRLFSKIRQGHKPGIKTVIRLGLALELNNEEFNDFLSSCNYSLYEDKYFDVAIKYFINNKIYDIDKCNDILYSCKLDLLVDYEK